MTPNYINIDTAGGSVLSCLLPLPANVTTDKIHDFYHSKDSLVKRADIDVFFYGINAEQAELKV